MSRPVSDVILSVFVACGLICVHGFLVTFGFDSRILNKVCLVVCFVLVCFGLRKRKPVLGCCGMLSSKGDTAVAILGPEQL